MWVWIVANYEGLLVVGGVVGLGLATWRSWVAGQQARAALKQSEAIEEQGELARRAFINARFQAGIELLAHENVGVRLGGVTVLTEMMHVNPDEYHVRVMRLFVAFLAHPPNRRGTDYVDIDGPDIFEILETFNSTGEEERELERAEKFNLEHALRGTFFNFENGKVSWNKIEHTPDGPKPETTGWKL